MSAHSLPGHPDGAADFNSALSPFSQPSGVVTGALAPLRDWRRKAFGVLLCGWLWHAGLALALDLNTATEAELDGLSGFGPAFTARVMQARAERPFHDWVDFMRRVKGVREPTARRLSQQGARIQEAPFAPSPARVSRD